MTTPAQVLKVVEGPRSGPDRIFSVVLSEPADDLSIVAQAADPGHGERAIPALGSAHPTIEGLVSGPPTVFAIGMRSDGVWLATRSNFYNVRVKYHKQEG